MSEKDEPTEDVNEDVEPEDDEDVEPEDDEDVAPVKDPKGLLSALRKERAGRKALEKKVRQQELAKLPEIERLKTERDLLQAERDSLHLDNLRYQVGAKLSLPPALIDRLKGDTVEEMEEDGTELLKHFKNTESSDTIKRRPPNDSKKPGGTPKGGPSMNELLRAAARGA